MGSSYTDLKAWQRALDLALDVYRCSRSFPKEEVYGLTSQMRRSAVSVPSNIAEGKGRFSQKELLQSLYRARGSLLELETQMLIAHELGYIPDIAFGHLRTTSSEVGKLLNGLVNRFQTTCDRNT
jgi:four helix bundle protein